LTISLPKKWVDEQNVKPGDEVEVVEDKNNLIVGVGEVRKIKKSTTIEIKDKNQFLSRFIINPYIKGYDEIIVRYSDSEIYSKVLETAKLLMGFEVIDNGHHYCKLLNISTKLEQNFDILLNRLFIGTLSFSKELFLSLKNNQKVDTLEEYELNINRIHLFCRRAIQTNTVGEINYSLPTLYSLVSKLEESADCLRDILFRVKNNKFNLDHKTIELFNACIGLQEINWTLFGRIKNDKKITNHYDLFIKHKDIREKVRTYYHFGDEFNSFISSKLFSMVETSHHINEELLS